MAGEQIVLWETYNFPFSRARYSRYHLLLENVKGKWNALACVQEEAGSSSYKLYQLADSTVRLELSDGGRGRPPILEVSRDGELVFRVMLGGRNPRPITIGTIKFIPCRWGTVRPEQLWGPSTKVEEVGKDKDSSSEDGGGTLQI
jgi:hypothetical protein